MPRSHKPAEVSQAVTRGHGNKYPVKGKAGQCPKSPTGGHWWRIESPSGATSTGVCRYCAAVGKFANTAQAAFSAGVSR